MKPQEEPQSAPIDLRSILWSARRYGFLPLVPLVLSLCGAAIALRYTTPIYASYVVVEASSGASFSSALAPLVRSGTTSRDLEASVQQLNNQIHGQAFLHRLVDKLDTARSPQLLLAARNAASRFKGITPEDYAMRVAMNSISQKITAYPAAQGQMRIQAEDSDPRQAQLLASTIATAIIEDRKQSEFERLRAGGEFSADQIAVYEDRLKESEAALRKFQESAARRQIEGNVVGEQNLDAARNLVQLTESEIDQIRDRITAGLDEWHRKATEGTVAPTLQSARVAALESRLGNLEMQHAITSLKGEGANSELAAFSVKIGDAREDLLNEYTSLAGRALPNQPELARIAAGISLDRAEIRSLRNKRTSLAGFISDYTRSVESAPGNQMELQRLQSEVATNRDLLLALRREATSSHMAEALQTSQLGMQLEVVEQPQIPLSPIRPDKKKVMTLALVVGLALSAGLVFGAERVGPVVRSVEEAERELGLKVIGTVPRIEGWVQPGSYLRRHAAILSIVFLLLVTAMIYSLPRNGSSPQGTRAESMAPVQ